MVFKQGLRLFPLGILSALVATLVHRATGVLSATAALWPTALVSIALCAASATALTRVEPPADASRDVRGALRALVIWCIALVATGVFRHEGYALAVALTSGFFARRFWRVDQSSPRGELVFALGYTAVATLAEVALSHAALRVYRHPEMGAVPVWLPALHLHFALVLHRVFSLSLSSGAPVTAASAP